MPSKELFESLDIRNVRGGYYKRYTEIYPDILQIISKYLGVNYVPSKEETWIDSEQANMKEMLNTLFDNMEVNKGYTKKQLIGFLNWKYAYNNYRDAYKEMVISKCVINIDRSKFGEFVDLFIIKNGIYYRKDSTKFE